MQDTRLLNITSYVVSQKHTLDNHRQQINELKTKISDIENNKTNLIKAQSTIDKITQIVSARGLGKIESIVSGGLKLVFGKNTSLVIDKREGTRGTNYKLLIKKGDTVGDPFDSFGGGVVNVASFLLRIIMIRRFKLQKMLFLDESMNNVSKEYLPKVSELIQTLVSNHGFSFLAISHQPELATAADNIYRVSAGVDGPVISRIEPDQLDNYDEIKISSGDTEKITGSNT